MTVGEVVENFKEPSYMTSEQVKLEVFWNSMNEEQKSAIQQIIKHLRSLRFVEPPRKFIINKVDESTIICFLFDLGFKVARQEEEILQSQNKVTILVETRPRPCND
jgi:hypothetical protein